jgi:hypothetical protein
MAKKAELKAVLSMDMSPFARGAARALATGKALARQFARNPVKLLATGAFLGAEKAISAIGSGIGKLPNLAAKAFGTLAKAGAVVGGVFAAGVVHAYNFGGEMQDMADRTGMPIGKLLVLTQALQDCGVEFEGLVPAVKKMNTALVAAAKSGNASAFEQIGLSVQELLNKEPADQFEAVATAISKLGSTAARTKASVDIFGKAGVNMLSFFADGEAMQTARDSLGKQAGILEKNAAVFDRISDRLGRVGAKIRGFFIGAGAGLAGIADNLTAQFDKVDLAPFGEKVAEKLKQAMKWGFAIWEDPMGTMGFFWAMAKVKAIELANWLHDAIERAFPGMAIAIEDAISKTIAWGKIIIGYATQFGTFLLDAAKAFTAWISNWWENSGIPEIWTLMKSATAPKEKEKYSKGTKAIVTRGGVVPGEPPDFNMDDSPRARTERAIANEESKRARREFIGPVIPKDFVAPTPNKGKDMVAEGMAQLAKTAKGAAEALEAAKVGADHFGAAAALAEAQAMRKKIEPAVKMADARMAAIGGGGGNLPFTRIFQKAQAGFNQWFNDPTRTRIRRENETRARIDRERNAVYKGPLGRREFEAFRNMAQAEGLKEIDGVPVRREGEVRRGDAARRKAFEKDQERKRLKGLTEKETLDELLNVAKDARDANKKVAKAIAE